MILFQRRHRSRNLIIFVLVGAVIFHCLVQYTQFTVTRRIWDGDPSPGEQKLSSYDNVDVVVVEPFTVLDYEENVIASIDYFNFSFPGVQLEKVTSIEDARKHVAEKARRAALLGDHSGHNGQKLESPLSKSRVDNRTHEQRFVGNLPKDDTGKGTGKPESLKTYNCSKGGNKYCLSSPIEVIISPHNACPQEQKVDLVLLISSAADHLEKRDAIRRTWALINDSTIQHAFLLALHPNVSQLALYREQQTHNDILQGNFVDSYRNLTIKTIMGYNWFRKQCPQAKFLMKTDDDMFINTNSLVKFAHRELGTAPRMAGYCTEDLTQPRRIPASHRWTVSVDQYPDKYYPRYCCGCGYIVSGEVARDIALAMQWLPVLPLEDVFAAVAATRIGYNVTILNRPKQFPSMGGLTEANKESVCQNLRNGTQLSVHGIEYYLNHGLTKRCL